MTTLKVILGLAVAVFIARACINFIDPSKVESELNGQWTKLETINGTTDQVSSVYEVPSGQVRVKWYAHNTEKRPGNFKLVAKNSEGGRVINDIASVTVAPRGVRSGDRIFAKAKKFYFEVTSTVAWEVGIEVVQ